MSEQSQGPGWWVASDGKWYPPHLHPTAAASGTPAAWPPAWAPTPAPGFGPPVPSTGMNGCLKAFLIVLGVGFVLVVAGSVAAVYLGRDAVERITNGDPTIDDDVAVVACAPDASGRLHATLRVANNSAERSNYLIEVAFESSSGETVYRTESVSADSVGSGQSMTVEVATSTAAPGEPVRCRVADVVRFTDEGP